MANEIELACEALTWYQLEAEGAARANADGAGEVLLAVATVMALDNGKRAREALAVLDAGDAKAEPVADQLRPLSFTQSASQVVKDKLFPCTQPDAETTRLRDGGMREGVAYFTDDKWGGYWQTVKDGKPYNFRTTLEARLAQAERAPAVTEALKPFAAFAENEVEWVGDCWVWKNGSMRERICDWFGPSDFGAALSQPQPPAEARIAEPAVKPLEWEHRKTPLGCEWWSAENPLGGLQYEAMNEADKRTIEARHEARIRAALSPATGEGKP